MVCNTLTRQALVAFMILGLAGCAMAPRGDGGAPVIDAPASTPAPSAPEQPRPGEPEAIPSPATAPTPSTGRTVIAPSTRPAAVEGLLDSARRQSAAGDQAAAAATLERALRIAPKDPLLWQRLATVRLAQGRWDLAEQMAAKSNSLAGDDRQFKADNWLLIANARQARGDSAGARRAREQARQASE